MKKVLGGTATVTGETVLGGSDEKGSGWHWQ